MVFTTGVEQAGDRQREWEEDRRVLCCELGEDLWVHVLLRWAWALFDSGLVLASVYFVGTLEVLGRCLISCLVDCGVDNVLFHFAWVMGICEGMVVL